MDTATLGTPLAAAVVVEGDPRALAAPVLRGLLVPCPVGGDATTGASAVGRVAAPCSSGISKSPSLLSSSVMTTASASAPLAFGFFDDVDAGDDVAPMLPPLLVFGAPLRSAPSALAEGCGASRCARASFTNVSTRAAVSGSCDQCCSSSSSFSRAGATARALEVFAGCWALRTRPALACCSTTPLAPPARPTAPPPDVPPRVPLPPEDDEPLPEEL
mmetsp:Transcript_16523/g.51280  ORF Transcript_16523/g.51280 Transcript_16523/m.51280 type:complete len:217 (-) Transcript_16523:342-992(-)